MSAKYKEIANSIEEEILKGVYNEVKKLPKEEDLINKYEASRTTIRKAISILVNKGYVYQVQGSGIFLREAAVKDYISLENLKGLTRDYPNKTIKSQVIDFKVVQADEELAKQMKCEINTNIYAVKRLREIDGIKFTLEYTYFNKNIIPYLNEEILTKSVYSYIINDLNLNIGFADKVIYADKLDEESANYLNLEVNDPALIIENTVFLVNGELFEVSKAIHNYKEAKLLKLASF